MTEKSVDELLDGIDDLVAQLRARIAAKDEEGEPDDTE